MKKLRFLLALLSVIPQLNAQSITSEEMNQLIGVAWEGELTYLNYSDNKEVTLPVTLAVTRKGKNKYIFAYTYPYEPKANRNAKIKIGKDGTTFSGEKIKSKETLEDGSVKITTTGKGKDNGKEAAYLFTYVIGVNQFTTKKEVTYEGEKDSFFRNGYTFKKKGDSE